MILEKDDIVHKTSLQMNRYELIQKVGDLLFYGVKHAQGFFEKVVALKHRLGDYYKVIDDDPNLEEYT